MTGLLVGRDAECAALRRAISTATGARGVAVILVAGEAGAGKTTLAERVLAQVPGQVLRGRAAEWAGTAFDALAGALRPVVTARHPERHPEHEILAQVMPELGTPPAAPDTGALAAAVCAVLGPGPTVLFLDDLQWADEATLGLLPPLADAASGSGHAGPRAGHAGHADGPARIAVVGCYRSDELPRGHRLRTVRAQLRKAGQLTEIDLPPLSDDEVRQMLAGLLGATATPALADAVTDRADGLPFAVQELAFALRDSGRLAYQGDTVTLTGAGAAPLPDGVREAVLLRASRLAEPERALLEAAAVAGTEFDIDTAAHAAAAAGTRDSDHWPDGFTAAGLLTESIDGRSAFRHALAREAAYADIPWTRRRRLHRALAAALTDGHPAGAGHSGAAALVARHLLAARDFGAARDALIAAADEHCAVHAYRDAARALRTALEHWPADADADADRLAVIGRLARCAEMCSEYADAVTLLRELADGHERRGELAALAGTHRRIALAHELRGQWEAALAARETAASVYARAGRCDEAAADRLAVAVHLRAAASYSAALATLSVARDDARVSGRTDLLLRADGLRGNVLSRLGNAAEGVSAVRAALDEALKAELTDTAAELQQRLADSLEHSGDYQAATAAYGTAYQYCDALGKDAVGQLCRACATAVLFARGEWDLAAAVCEDVLAEAESAQHSRAVAACVLGLVHALRGDLGAARPHLLEASVIAARIELTAVELLSAWGLAVLEDQAGARTAATDRLRQALARVNGTQERHYCVPALQWAATFFGRHGLADDAHACAAALSAISEATGQPEAIATLAHALGETLLPDDPATAVRELCRAATMFDDLGLPFPAAQARHRAATAAIVSGDTPAARRLVLAARRAAERLGARQLLDGCGAALGQLDDSEGGGAIGGDETGAVAARGRGGGSSGGGNRKTRAVAGLTARELDVMRLIADGNTARQAGAALFISPRTVEMHVQGCLLKLGCRTRAEAVRRLAELGALVSAR